jgi:hypothetical protein
LASETGNFCRRNTRFSSACETGFGSRAVPGIESAARGGTAIAGQVGVKVASGASLIAKMSETAAKHANAAFSFAEYSSLGGDTIARTLVESNDGMERKSIGPANPSPEIRQLAKVVRQAA